jgi:peptide/nickel transport system substrate-binding protein
MSQSKITDRPVLPYRRITLSRRGLLGTGSGMIAGAVSSRLQPVKERLPEQPLVVEPIESVGRYGGTWHSAMITQEDASWLGTIIGYEPMVRWARDWTDSPGTDEILPNICEFAELEGGKVFEFTLRKGLRWSDGEPCTVEDFRFTYEDINVYPDMHPGGLYGLWLSPDTERPAEFTVVDDSKIRFTFTAPKPGFLNEIASSIPSTTRTSTTWSRRPG